MDVNTELILIRITGVDRPGLTLRLRKSFQDMM